MSLLPVHVLLVLYSASDGDAGTLPLSAGSCEKCVLGTWKIGVHGPLIPMYVVPQWDNPPENRQRDMLGGISLMAEALNLKKL